MLFSDWDRSGRARPAGQQRPALLPRLTERQEQLWRIDAGRAAAPLHRGATAGDGCASGAWASPARTSTGDGQPEVYLTSQGDNKLQTLVDGADRPDLRGHRPRARGATAHRPFAGGDVRALDRLARRSSRTSTTTASWTCSWPRATWRRSPTTPRRIPATCSSASRTARSWRAPRRPASSTSRGAAGRRVVDLNLDGLLDIVEVKRRENVQALAQRRRRATRRPRRRWATGRPSAWSSRPRTADAIGAWVRSRSATGRIERELTVGGGHVGGQLGWHALRARAGRAAPRSACSGRTARSGRGCPCRRTASRSSSGARTRSDRGRRAASERQRATRRRA